MFGTIIANDKAEILIPIGVNHKEFVFSFFHIQYLMALFFQFLICEQSAILCPSNYARFFYRQFV